MLLWAMQWRESKFFVDDGCVLWFFDMSWWVFYMSRKNVGCHCQYV